MKKLISLLLWVSPVIITYGQINKTVSPTYLAMLLLDQPNTSKMETVCQYYKLTKVNDRSEDMVVYQHLDGTVFKFKVYKEDEKLFPEIIVNSNSNQEKIEKILKEAGYVKTDDGYVKGTRFEHRTSRCRVTGTTHKTLIFTKEYKTE